jgi:hypothetical protein
MKCGYAGRNEGRNLRQLEESPRAVTNGPANSQCGADVLYEPAEKPGADRWSPRPVVPSRAAPYVLRLEGVPATPASLARIRERVKELNRQFQQADVPFRLRVL